MKTNISVILDASGSMESIKEATLSGLNEYLQSLQNQPDVFVTLTKFNSDSIDVLYANVPAKDVSEELLTAAYTPSGMTPLYDAIGTTLEALDEKMAKCGEARSLVVIITDGEENASKEYTHASIKTGIQEREKRGWTFVYLGANQDAWLVGGGLGMQQGNTLNYAASAGGTKVMYSALRASTQSYLASSRATADPDGFFSTTTDRTQ